MSTGATGARGLMQQALAREQLVDTPHGLAVPA